MEIETPNHCQHGTRSFLHPLRRGLTLSKIEISKMLKDIELNAKRLSLVRLNVSTENQARYTLSWLAI